MRTIAIIQARMTSSRLPGKVLADIAGKPALEQMLLRVRRAHSLDGVWIATTANRQDDPVAELAATLGVPVHRGDEHNVLKRFHEAAMAAKAELCVRLTADCPMMDPAVIDQVVAEFHRAPCDYCSNAVIRSFPKGLDVEVFTRAALDRAAAEADHPYHREHVTPFINGAVPEGVDHGHFVTRDVVHAPSLGPIRWTVDYPEDLAVVRDLFARLPQDFTWQQALEVTLGDADLCRRAHAEGLCL